MFRRLAASALPALLRPAAASASASAPAVAARALSTSTLRLSTAVRLSQDAKEVAHYNVDNRAALFAKSNPNRIRAGAIVQVTSLTSMTKGKPVAFAGIVTSVRHKGIDTSLTLRNYVLKTGVEQTYKVFSPMVTAIKVLQPNKSFTRSKIYFVRENPKLVKWGQIDDLVKTEMEKTKAAEGGSAAASGKAAGKGGKGKGKKK
ncbi:ribosomal protein L19 [Allomyces macrogynus ATCC 38327]|uniref:Ribosomal protein L19 n=1 Tax=Allomyces macrogynus (strain ATCC 38327) TaxID=578462 RepID=A0A0L0T3A8_ALLM3|nr:ribosomal protein L19 [Allomyces macrogynus ATCC 38327]|eukprot:KNE69160.1 ribosomal protein L19 [Allomyces macrogynus ATCC 38327]